MKKEEVKKAEPAPEDIEFEMVSDDEGIMEDNFFLDLSQSREDQLEAIKKWTMAQVKQLLGKE